MASVTCEHDYDVAIVGGGPAGSTLAAFLRKYAPDIRVIVIEREVFPRDHVGESQLPPITRILAELGIWDRVEAEGFPIKTGAMYRWGNTQDLWRFDFLAGEEFLEEPRPTNYRGQRRQTTFHVNRAVYDKLLLDHAEELGSEVRQGTRVKDVLHEGDRVTALTLVDGITITARYFIDATGHSGFLRRAMGVGIEEPTQLKNIAIWDYWHNPEWAQTVCKGGTRVRVMSLGYGWIWFIPLSETTASIGLVTTANYFKDSGLKAPALYAEALAEETYIASLVQNATSEDKLASTKDWSFLSERAVGQNWFLVGESVGFADPILAAGMTLAQVGARELAHILIALIHETHDAEWLKAWYEKTQLKRIGQHIRFADFWYSANTHFTDLKAFTAKIAKDAGLDLDPDEGFRWLAAGGFVSDDLTSPLVASYQLGSAKYLMQILTDNPATWEINKYNEFRLNTQGAEKIEVPSCEGGKITSVTCYQRGNQLLPITGMYRLVVRALQNERDAVRVIQIIANQIAQTPGFGEASQAMASVYDALEGMIAEGWIIGKRNNKRPFLDITLDEDSVSFKKSPIPATVSVSG